MMKLTTMVRGLAGDKAARELIRNWEFDEGTLKFWRASSNFVYVFNRDGERYFLRFNFEEEHTAQQLTAELEFMQYLLKHEYPCVASFGEREMDRDDSGTGGALSRRRL
ncbi:hypothetical protein [Paenibacillus lautus]|uniref:hypothetical protein n=1 Tax=Paenibacillus lautus TaxID=1401 RepID=UPI001FCA4903|nr:hypothetical protein [Paenibacillus lautus]